MDASRHLGFVDWRDEHLHFVTGRLASKDRSHNLVRELAGQLGFRYTVETLPISVAALMTPRVDRQTLESCRPRPRG